MRSRALYIVLGIAAGGILLIGVIVIKNHQSTTSPNSQTAASRVLTAGNHATDEGAKVLKGMYDHKKSTTPVHGLFPTQEASTQEAK